MAKLLGLVVDPIGWQERTQELRDLGTAPNLAQANVRNTFGRLKLNPLAPPPPDTTIARLIHLIASSAFVGE